MSDFLTNLVMRSFAQMPSVQPMTLSTYAAPEPQIDPDPVERVIEPVQKTEPVKKTEPVQHMNERELVIERAPLAEAPLAEVPLPQQDRFEHSELPHPEPTHKSVFQPVMSKPDQTIAPPAQTPPQRVLKPAVRIQKVAEPLIVEQVIEHVVERPSVKTIERPTTTTIEQSTIETIERPSVTSIERSIEQSSITIENTEHVTNSFTTLVPKVTPQSIPALNLKPRPTTPPAAIAGEEQEQAPTTSPETVINVAIGRIEVRATPAPKPRREREQGPKVMTLDDYLQQRSRGTQ